MSVANSLANVYLVEDSYGDIVLTKAILKANRLKLELFVFRDGEEVIAQLKDCEDDKKPDLVLLDINLPKVGGVQVMHYMNDHSWGHVPIFIISGSRADADKEITAELGAQHYLKKPLDLPQLREAIEPLTNIILLQKDDAWQLFRA